MSNLRKIIAWILTFSIAVFTFCVPTFASVGGGGRPQPTPEGVLKQQASFSQWVGGAFQRVFGYSAGAACPNSEDNFHYANDYLRWSKDGNGAITYTCQCAACGVTFTAYESDLKQSYDNQVAELPATGYNSAGRLIWQPTIDDVERYSFYVSSDGFSGSHSVFILCQMKDPVFLIMVLILSVQWYLVLKVSVFISIFLLLYLVRMVVYLRIVC